MTIPEEHPSESAELQNALRQAAEGADRPPSASMVSPEPIVSNLGELRRTFMPPEPTEAAPVESGAQSLRQRVVAAAGGLHRPEGIVRDIIEKAESTLANHARTALDAVGQAPTAAAEKFDAVTSYTGGSVAAYVSVRRALGVIGNYVRGSQPLEGATVMSDVLAEVGTVFDFITSYEKTRGQIVEVYADRSADANRIGVELGGTDADAAVALTTIGNARAALPDDTSDWTYATGHLQSIQTFRQQVDGVAESAHALRASIDESRAIAGLPQAVAVRAAVQTLHDHLGGIGYSEDAFRLAAAQFAVASEALETVAHGINGITGDVEALKAKFTNLGKKIAALRGNALLV